MLPWQLVPPHTTRNFKGQWGCCSHVATPARQCAPGRQRTLQSTLHDAISASCSSCPRTAALFARPAAWVCLPARGSQGHAGTGPSQNGQQQRRRSAAKPQSQSTSEAQQLNSAQRRSAARREVWWQKKLSNISAGTEASHARSTSMVVEMQCLLHEMQHGGAVPGESPAPALLSALSTATEAAAIAG